MAERPHQKLLPGMEPESEASPPVEKPVRNPEGWTPSAVGSPPPATLEGKTVYVIDTHSLVYQVFHALPEMTSPTGQPVNAVYGFVRDLFTLLTQKKPDYLFAAVDLPGKTFRHELYEPYKIQRRGHARGFDPAVAGHPSRARGDANSDGGAAGLRGRRRHGDDRPGGRPSSAGSASSSPATRTAGS